MAECSIETDNEYVRNFGQMLQPQPTLMEQQQQQLLEQANGEIQNRDQQIVQLQQRIAQLEQEQKINAYSLDREMLLAEQKHKFEMEKLAFEKQLEEETPAEQAKSQAEIVKAQASVEKSLVDLRKTEINAVSKQNGGIQ
jgi:hypothetical protein